METETKKKEISEMSKEEYHELVHSFSDTTMEDKVLFRVYHGTDLVQEQWIQQASQTRLPLLKGNTYTHYTLDEYTPGNYRVMVFYGFEEGLADGITDKLVSSDMIEVFRSTRIKVNKDWNDIKGRLARLKW